MVEKYTPIPYEERKSQHVGLRDAASWFGMIGGIFLASVGADFAARKIALRQGLDTGMAKKIGYCFFAVTHAVGLFMVWKKNETAHLGVSDIYENYKDVTKLHVTDEALEQYNQLLKKEIAFEQAKQRELQETQPLSRIIGEKQHIAPIFDFPAQTKITHN